MRIKLFRAYGHEMELNGVVGERPDPTPAAVAMRPARKMWMTVVATAVINLAMLPAHIFLGLLIIFSTLRSDSSGSGGPFRGCTAESVSCVGPHYGLLIVASLIMLALCFLGAFLGYGFGRCRPGRHRLLQLTVLSIFVSVAGTVVVIGGRLLR